MVSVVDVYSATDVKNATRVVIKELIDIYDNIKGTALSPDKMGPIVQTRLQLVFKHRLSNPLYRSIMEIIVSHAHAAEKLGPGGFDRCIETFIKKFNANDKKNALMLKSAKLSDIVGAGARAATTSDIEWIINEYAVSSDQTTRSMLLKALELAGFAGRIMVEKARTLPSVELVRGYTFEQAPAWSISIRFEEPRVICIDGYIEAVSELHHLLEEAAESKDPVLLFVRGMTDDVKHTLRVNFDRGSLRVVPIIVWFDLDGINAMNDISIACGVDLVSSNKGDLISNVRLHDAPRINNAYIHPTKVVVSNNSSAMAVATQVENLKKKRLNEKIDDVARLYDTRIKSLSPNHVVVRLKDDKDFVTAAQTIDYSLRAIRSMIDHGVIEVDGIQTLTTTAIASEVYSTRCFDAIASMGAYIKL